MKALWGMEKMLVISNFFFSDNVSKRPLSQGHLKPVTDWYSTWKYNKPWSNLIFHQLTKFLILKAFANHTLNMAFFVKPDETRAVTKCDLIPPPALWQTLVFCTQKDRHTDRRTHGWTDKLIPVYPWKLSFCQGIIKKSLQI